MEKMTYISFFFCLFNLILIERQIATNCFNLNHNLIFE